MIKKGDTYIARSPHDLIGWDIQDIIGEDAEGLTIVTMKSRQSGVVRYVHCSAEAIPLWVLQKNSSNRK